VKFKFGLCLLAGAVAGAVAPTALLALGVWVYRLALAIIGSDSGGAQFLALLAALHTVVFIPVGPVIMGMAIHDWREEKRRENNSNPATDQC